MASVFYESQFALHEITSTSIEIEAEANNKDSGIELDRTQPIAQRITYHHRAISSLKNKNSTGIDGVSNIILKLLPNEHLQILVSTFNAFATSLRTPTTLARGENDPAVEDKSTARRT